MPAPYKGRIYDPACGSGGMFTLLKDRIQQINPQSKVFLYGQELNPQTWAIARSDMLIHHLAPYGMAGFILANGRCPPTSPAKGILRPLPG